MRHALTGLVLLLAAAGALAQEGKRVTLDLEDVTVADAAKAIGEKLEVEIDVSRSLAKKKVSIRLEDRPLAVALQTLAKGAADDGEAVELKDGSWRIRRKGEDDSPEVRNERKLENTLVNLNFQDTGLQEALSFLAQYSGVPIVVDPALAKAKSPDELLVNLQADGVSVKNALDLLTLTKGIRYDLRWGCVFVATEDRLAALPKEVLPPPAEDAKDWEVALRKKLRGPDGKITFSFAAATVTQAIDFIRTLKGVNIVFDPEARKTAEAVTFDGSVTDVPLESALAQILIPRGFTFSLADGVILVE